MSNEDPFGDGSVTVTIKAGKGYEVPWIVIKGSSAAEAKKHLAEATGLSGEGLSLAQLTYNASQHFQRIDEVGTVLDAVVLPEEQETEAPSPAAEPEPEPEQAEEHVSIDHAALIQKINVKKDLQDYFLANKDVFSSDKDLMAALQARFKEV